MQPGSICVGIDVSKAHLDMALYPGDESIRVAYDVQGMATVIARVSAASPTRIVVEATGGVERPLLRALLEAALPVVSGKTCCGVCRASGR